MAMTDKEIHHNFAINIYRLRCKRKWSLKRVAELCRCAGWKCYAASIDRLEKKKVTPKFYHVYRLAKTFDVTIDKLIGPPIKIPVDRNIKKDMLPKPKFDDGI